MSTIKKLFFPQQGVVEDLENGSQKAFGNILSQEIVLIDKPPVQLQIVATNQDGELEQHQQEANHFMVTIDTGGSKIHAFNALILTNRAKGEFRYLRDMYETIEYG